MTGALTAAAQDLVRMLVELQPRAAHDDDILGDPNAEEIILDVEVDGSRYLLIRFPNPARAAAQTKTQLSPRELEIVRLVALGHPNKIIADLLNISSWTVCTHLRRIFAKLGVGSRAAMVAQMSEVHAARGPAPPSPRLPALAAAPERMRSARPVNR